jgi:NAD/FAD-utilizing enzyme apparently involved in cell division
MRKGFALGLIPASAVRRLEEKERRVASAREFLSLTRIAPAEANVMLTASGSEPITEAETEIGRAKRSEIGIESLLSLPVLRSDERIRIILEDRDARERTQIETKYEGYLKRQDEQIREFQRGEEMEIPRDFDFATVKSLSTEGREKLVKVKPRSIGQAARISGLTPADISILMICLAR